MALHSEFVFLRAICWRRLRGKNSRSSFQTRLMWPRATANRWLWRYAITSLRWRCLQAGALIFMDELFQALGIGLCLAGIWRWRSDTGRTKLLRDCSQRPASRRLNLPVTCRGFRAWLQAGGCEVRVFDPYDSVEIGADRPC